ncbi:MAG: DNA-binding transcriptional regulator Fis [Gammaproteobacteria bacterium]|nr:DNA-binding transcriptional regulator Fis [Gammaproteobacteria bacterium]
MTRARRKDAGSPADMGETLRDCVRKSMDKYFHDLDGEQPCQIYQMVLAEVERPLLESVMVYTRGNQSHAADCLGISRSTLRKKLKIYKLD